MLAKYASYEKKNICALRMKAEFLKAYGTPKDAEDLLCSYIDWAAEDPSSDRAYTQCFNLITSRKEGLAINAEAVEKLSRAALGRLTNCNPYDWRPWANLTMLLRQGITIEPVWQHKTWRVIHLTPPKGTTDAELEVDYVLAKAAFCEVVCGTDDSLTKRWVSRLHCRESFEEVKDYAKYYEATAGSEVYRIITYDLRCGDIDYDDDDDDDDVETFPMSQQSPVPLKKAKNEHKDKTTSH